MFVPQYQSVKKHNLSLSSTYLVSNSPIKSRHHNLLTKLTVNTSSTRCRSYTYGSRGAPSTIVVASTWTSLVLPSHFVLIFYQFFMTSFVHSFDSYPAHRATARIIWRPQAHGGHGAWRCCPWRARAYRVLLVVASTIRQQIGSSLYWRPVFCALIRF
jgi:hypothetical protein